jgi:phenylacetate-CoA ligase
MIRYDIGDCIMINPDKCKCGNPNPAFKVQGRSADALVFMNETGEQVIIPSLMFVTLIDRFVKEVEAFQVLQTSPTTLEIRLQYSSEIKEEIKKQQWNVLVNELTKILKDRGLNEIRIVRSTELPQRTKGGKFRMVIPDDKT